MLNIKLDESNLRQIENVLESMPNQLPGAIARAINRSLAMTKTEQLRSSTSMYTIARGKLAESITEYKASSGNLTGKIYSSGKVIGLDHFKLSPKTRLKKQKISCAKNSTRLVPLRCWLLPFLVQNCGVNQVVTKLMVKTFTN